MHGTESEERTRLDAQTAGGFWYVPCDLCHMSLPSDAQSGGRGTAATYSFFLHARSSLSIFL